jgi:hypothetical protein
VTQQTDVTLLLRKRRDRAIAIVLGLKEREVDQYLPPQVSTRLRKVVLDQLNELYDCCLDMMGASEGTWIVNELYQQKLNEVADGVEEIRRILGVPA